MFDPESLVRPHIRRMPAYEPILPFEVLSRQLGRRPEDIVKLDANENPYGLLPVVRKALAELPFPHIYPDPGSRELCSALATLNGIPEECLLIGAGADELIDLVLRLVIEPGDVVLNCPPTFGMYRFDSDLNCAQVVDIMRHEDFSLNLLAIEQAAVRNRAKILFLASPNNPDGSLIPLADLERLLTLPLLVVLDEAYIEFAPPRTSMIERRGQWQNLVVLRTFSKWAGLAGLRVGYGVFPNQLMPHLWKAKQPYNVNVAAATAALISLQHMDELQEVGRKLLVERSRLFKALQRVSGLQPYPTNANFILCKVVGRDAARLKNDLAREGVLVRYFNKPGLYNCIRISVGRPEDTDRLLAALELVLYRKE